MARHESPNAALWWIQHDSLWCWRPASRLCSRSWCPDRQQHDTSTMWLASAFISYASYVSTDGPWRQMLHTRWFGPWFTPELTTVTDCWPPVPSTCTRSYSLFSVPPPDLFCSSHIVRLFPELCKDSCTAWFETPDRVRFKLCTLVYRCLHGLAPSYLSDLCTPATVHAHLRSSGTLERSLSIPRTKAKTLGLRGFYFASSSAWIALPVHLRDPELSLNSFKTKLKTHFFPDPTWAIFII